MPSNRCYDPGAGYIYSNYRVEDAILSGRIDPSRPNWQWWPRPAIGLRQIEASAKLAQEVMAEQWADAQEYVHSLIPYTQKFLVDNSESRE